MTLLVCSIGLTSVPVFAKNADRQVVSSDYMRYASMGRSDTLITLSLYGAEGSAIVSRNSDGTFNCRVSGLAIPDEKVSTSALLEQKGKLIHESTHCLVLPYMRILPDDESDPLVRVANDLIILMAESASDVRAIIEIYRKDGLREAREYAAMLIDYRGKTKRVFYSTVEAINLALEIVTHDSKRVQSDGDAFYTALHIARWNAESTIRTILRENGNDDMMLSASTIATLAAMDATIKNAMQTFNMGRYENSAVTVRTKYEGSVTGDVHMFLAHDGTVRTEATLGDEHAHELVELKALMAASTTAEQVLAVEALTKYGLLSKNNLLDTQILFTRWVKTFTHDEPVKRTAACRLIARVIADTQVIESVGDLYDKVTYTLQREFD